MIEVSPGLIVVLGVEPVALLEKGEGEGEGEFESFVEEGRVDLGDGENLSCLCGVGVEGRLPMLEVFEPDGAVEMGVDQSLSSFFESLDPYGLACHQLSVGGLVGGGVSTGVVAGEGN